MIANPGSTLLSCTMHCNVRVDEIPDAEQTVALAVTNSRHSRFTALTTLLERVMISTHQIHSMCIFSTSRCVFLLSNGADFQHLLYLSE
jgi:hypothetical protein